MSLHLAGIVPVVTKPMDFQLDWHDCLMPIAPNFYAIERAVLECAYAGSNTIWIIANDDTTPLVRHRIGDYIQDPVCLRRRSRYPSQQRRPIPIFYVPMATKHENKRNSISWTTLFGAKTSLEIGGKISKWINPERFYVSFPYSVYPVDILRPSRLNISKDINFALTYGDKSFKTNDMLGFTFNKEHLIKIMDVFRETENSFLLGDNLSNEEEFFEKNFSLDKTFGCAIMDIDEGLSVPWYYPIDSWDAYCKYLASEERTEVRHPGKLVISYREWNPVGEDNE
jgi:hypothetical protein